MLYGKIISAIILLFVVNQAKVSFAYTIGSENIQEKNSVPSRRQLSVNNNNNVNNNLNSKYDIHLDVSPNANDKNNANGAYGNNKYDIHFDFPSNAIDKYNANGAYYNQPLYPKFYGPLGYKWYWYRVNGFWG